MSTPESTPETPELGDSARERQDDLTQSIGTLPPLQNSGDKKPLWKRLLGRA